MTDSVKYRLLMQQALLASQQNDLPQAERYYSEAQELIKNSRSENTLIDYHIAVGEFYLSHQKYNLALSELLFGYWKAIEGNKSARLAKVNRLLAQLFEERRVLDKALEYLSQAADFYDGYPNSPILAQVMERMGNIYFRQGKYNLALVHYFNVLDHDSSTRDVQQVVSIRLSLAATYLQLYNYPLAEQYLERALEVLEFADIPKLKAQAALLKSGLAFYQNDSQGVIANANKALDITASAAEEHLAIRQQAYQLLSLGYEQGKQFDLALESLKHYNQLVSIEQKNSIRSVKMRFVSKKSSPNKPFTTQAKLNSSKNHHRARQVPENRLCTVFALTGAVFTPDETRRATAAANNADRTAHRRSLYPFALQTA